MFRIFLLLACLSSIHCFLEETSSLESRYAALEVRVKQLEAAKNNCPCVPAVGFNVQLMRDMSPFVVNRHIIFDHVLTNIGGGYDTSNGQFWAPYDGIYAFVVSFTKTPGHGLSVEIVKNGKRIAQGITNTKDEFDTATISATVDLKKGDKVWAQSGYPADNVEELHGIWTYFSGHLVMPM